MVRNPLDMNLVFKRNLCMSDNREKTESGYWSYLNAYKCICNKSSEKEINESVKVMLKEYSTKRNMQDGYKRCLEIFELLNKNEYDNILSESVNRFSRELLPYCEDLNAVRNKVISSDMGNHITTLILESMNNLRSCDYMIRNHEKLIKRFTTDGILPIGDRTPLDEICYSICEMIDTYDIQPRNKIKLCLEEIVYFTDKNSISCNEQEMLESVVDYFLSSSNNTKDTIDDYKQGIVESKIVSLQADKRIKFLMKDNKPIKDEKRSGDILYELDMVLEEYGKDKVKELINSYKLETEKSDSKFQHFLKKIFTQSPKNIIEDTPDILKWVRNFVVLIVAAQSPIAAVVTFLVNGYTHFDMRKKETERVIKYFENELNHVESMIIRTSNSEKEKQLESYTKELENAISKLKAYNDSLYTDDELMNKEDNDVNFDESYTLDEANKIVMKNLISDAMAADETIEKIIKNNEIPVTKTVIHDNITMESAFKYIDPEGRISCILHSYDTSKCNDLSKLYESADSVVKTINNMLSKTDGKVYYTMMEGCIDFIFRSKFKIITTLNEDAMIANYMTDSELIRTTMVVESANLMEHFFNMEPQSIVDRAIKRIGLISHEEASMFVEAWSLGVPIEKDDMERFIREYYDYQIEIESYHDAYDIKKLFKEVSIKSPEIDSLKDIIECTQIMQDIITEGVDLNSLKLGWMSFKKKLKTLSAKEKEAARDLDVNFNNLMKGMQNFYKVTDHREQLIKGQVVPSLSKLIKIGLSLAVLGIASGGVIFPAIAAVTGIAISKNTNDKERKYILDEYDIELKVVERELRKIEESGKSSKKYRQLLTYQKNLQRGKQQIVYHLSSKGKRIPMSSTAGMKGGDE